MRIAINNVLPLIAIFLLPTFSFSQIVVDDTVDPETLVEDILLGQGVQVFNVQWNAPDPRYGYFDGTASNIGMDDGITLATKNVGIAECGPMVDGSGAGSDDDLSAILGAFSPDLHDVTILEFDFIPQGDSIEFTFVFASREYTAFVNSTYNDVFGFFLSGPGINGDFTNDAENIAVLPDGTPITINNVNPGQNAAYYVPNGDNTGDNNVNQGDPSYLCFGGYTVPITVGSAVECGETYHLKIAIANVSDGIRDSQVFLEGGSLSSNFVEIDVSTSGDSILNAVYGENSIVQGCSEGLVQFIRTESDSAATIHFDIGGTAVNGVHYEEIDDSIHFDIGVDTVPLSIIPIETADINGETVELTIYQVNLCGDTIEIEVEFTLISEYEIITDYPDTLIQCDADSFLIGGFYGSGVPPFEVEWYSDPGYTDLINVTDSLWFESEDYADTTFYIQVTDYCGTVEQDLMTVSFDFPPLPVVSTSPYLVQCPGDDVEITIDVDGGIAPINYEWSTGGNGETEIVTVNGEEYIYVTIIESGPCEYMVTDSVLVDNEYEVSEIDLSVSNSLINYNCDVNASIIFTRPNTDGEEDFTFTLGGNAVNGTSYEEIDEEGTFADGEDTLMIDVIPLSSGGGDTIVIYIHDDNPCTPTQTDTIFIVETYEIDATITEDMIFNCPIDYDIDLEASGHDGNEPYTYTWYENEQDPDNEIGSGETITVDPNNETTTYIVYIEDGCEESTTAEVTITFDIAPPPVITMPEDIMLTCPGDEETLTVVDVEEGLEPYSYEWSTGSEDPSTTVSPNETTTYTVTVTDDCGFETIAEVTVIVDYDPVQLLLDDQYEVTCSEEAITIEGEAFAGVEPYSYLWENGDQTAETVVTPSETTVYELTVEDHCGSEASATTTVIVPEYDPLTVNVMDDTLVCPDSDLFLWVSPSGGAGGYTYQWTGEGEILADEEGNATVFYMEEYEDTRYNVNIFDLCGNFYQAFIEVGLQDCEIIIPNIITPNNDGVNDAFHVANLEFHTNTKLKIFNRWGNLVYETEDYNNNWRGTKNNGTELADGTYFYILTLTTEDKVFEGTVQIAR